MITGGILVMIVLLARVAWRSMFPRATIRKRWRKWLDRSDILIVDTETTGLGQRAEVLEVAVLDTTGAPRFEALSLPQGPIARAASNVHGLTRRTLKDAGARKWPDVHSELVAAISGARILLAWNARFDAQMLEQTAKRHGLEFPNMTWHDLLESYRVLVQEAPRKGRHTLTAVARRECTDLTGVGDAHRAMGDCQLVLAVMRAVAKK